MAQKHLRELLKEDQEPFLLNTFISEKRNQLKKTPNSPNTTLQLKRQKPKPIPIQKNSHFPSNLCKNGCFISFQNATTPNITKSPLYSPAKSPLRASNAIFLHIPAKTAALLLEAALRIQKHSNTTKPKKISKNDSVLGVLGSFFKRLKTRKKEIEGGKVSVKDILRWESSVGRKSEKDGYWCEKVNGGGDDVAEGVGSCEVGFRSSCSGVWSESNEELETSSSGGNSYYREDFVEEGIEFVEKQQKKQSAECDSFDDRGFFCKSPFRFVLQRCPSSSSGHQTPEFSSPPASPSRLRTEDKESNGVDGISKFQSEEVEEDKEQCSPVSVLDPPFDDDDDNHDLRENDDEEDGFDLECSYANVQRTTQQLLDRLRRFERLAELDPIELEKRMLDQEDKKYETYIEEDDYADDDRETSCEEKALREIVFEILCQSSVDDRWEATEDLKRLVYDLIMEEQREFGSSEDRNVVITSVCRRLELWKEVESNTIDMMIEEDFSREEGMWKKNAEQRMELARELELGILCFLVEEVSEELLC